MREKILFIGDSHSIHCFANGTVDVFYVIDVTLNKIRKHNSDLLVNYGGFFTLEHIHKYEIDENGESLLNIINKSNYDTVLFTIGEIDIRYHSSKLIDESIFNNTLDFFEQFLKKIRKNIIIMSIIPPGSSPTSDRILLTKKLNSHLIDLTSRNNYLYFDIYNDFVKDEILDYSKSDGGVHISKNFQSYILEKLNNLTT